MSSQRASSSRAFGLVFVAFFFAVGVLHVYYQGKGYAAWFAAGSVLLLVSLLMPRLLAPLKRLWLKLGALLAVIVSPVILALVYVLSITLIGLILRLFGKDLLSMRRDPSASSYWGARHPAGPDPQSLRRQF